MQSGPIGIIILDSRFPRIRGDMGHPKTWPFPVIFSTVKGATPERVVRQTDTRLIEPFIEAGRELIQQGAIGITTTCGFLSLFQEALSDALEVPVVTSSLLQVRMVDASLGKDRRVGILTISAEDLTADHLYSANVPDSVAIGATDPASHFNKTILGDMVELDVHAARNDTVDAALYLQKEHPDLGAIVLECTNMTPFAADISKATNLPVYSIVTLIKWMRAGLVPVRF